MLYRKGMKVLQAWKEKPEKKALLVTGARQIGKTYLIRKFGQTQYRHFAEINFITDPGAAEIFSGSLHAEQIIMNLTAYLRTSLVPGETLIFFDEIQECPQARTAIKFLVEDGRFDYIESGSLLGVNYKEVKSYPVGYEEIFQMFPMDFEEFAAANGVQPEVIAALKDCFDNMTKVSPAIHRNMCDLFRNYVVVGGMPAVVQEFVNSHDIGAVVKMQQDILSLYRQDIAKCAKEDKVRITGIFDRIPAQLNSKNRRFILADIAKSARMERYENSFLWLSDAGVGLPCYNITEPKAPLKLNEQSNLFKLYLNDTGLLCAASMENVQFDILKGDLSVNMGGILENVFAQLLSAAGFTLRYMNKKIGEIDFVLQRGKKILPVEIKSGKDYKAHKALDNGLNTGEWDLQEGIVFCGGNTEQIGKIRYLPWYMIMFFHQEKLPDSLIVSWEPVTFG